MTDFPNTLAAWFTKHTAELQTEGIRCGLGRSPDDGRNKASAWLTLESETHLASIMVWDTGEAELDCAELSNSQVHSEHRNLQTLADLADALAAVTARVRQPAD